MVGPPCVTVRRNTERQITVEIGSNRLVEATTEGVMRGIEQALASGTGWEHPARWDLEVSSRVVAALESGVLPLKGFAKGEPAAGPGRADSASTMARPVRPHVVRIRSHVP